MKSIKYLAIAILLLASAPVMAHHVLAGMPMSTFVHGLMSGVAHPILAFDHLFFIMILGVTAFLSGRKHIAIFLYIVAMLTGCLLLYVGIDFPIKETIIALSLLILGATVLFGHRITLAPTILLFIVFGLFHGSAFGETLTMQEAKIGGTVLIGYLFGLGVIQYLIAMLFCWFVSYRVNTKQSNYVSVRLIGAAVAGIGLFLTMELLEQSIFSIIGII